MVFICKLNIFCKINHFEIRFFKTSVGDIFLTFLLPFCNFKNLKLSPFNDYNHFQWESALLSDDHVTISFPIFVKNLDY